MNLYYVTYTDCDGDNMDLFVSAESPKQAFDLWGKYYEDWNKTGGDRHNTVMIDEVPVAGNLPIAHNWETIAHVGAFDAATGGPSCSPANGGK
jgi:hypothetical protein